MGSETRRRAKIVPVRVSPDELATIRDNAAGTSLATSTFMRETAIGHRPRSTVDRQAVHRLAILRADLGRVGGLLRMWLANDERVAFGESLDVPGLVVRIDELRARIEAAVREL